MLDGATKLEAEQWDSRWNCWHSESSGRETRVPDTDRGCLDLMGAAKKYYTALPNGSPLPEVGIGQR